jgi:hypothetical protein
LDMLRTYRNQTSVQVYTAEYMSKIRREFRND